jgi:hypothetical protein
MRNAWLGGLAAWAGFGILGYEANIPLLEWAAGIGLAIWLIVTAFGLLCGRNRLQTQQHPNSEHPGTHN